MPGQVGGDKTLAEEGTQECPPGGECLLSKVLRCGRSDWLSDLPTVTQPVLSPCVLSCEAEDRTSEGCAAALCSAPHQPPLSLALEPGPHLLPSFGPAFPRVPTALSIFSRKPPLTTHTYLDVPGVAP